MLTLIMMVPEQFGKVMIPLLGLDLERWAAALLLDLRNVFLHVLNVCLLWRDLACELELCDIVPTDLDVSLYELKTDEVAQIDICLCDDFLMVLVFI